MSSFKPYPELHVDSRADGVARICNTAGDDVLVVIEGDKATLDRLVECWNACRKFYSPANHIEASDEYGRRVEALRKEAWARVCELEAQITATPQEPTPAAVKAA